MSDRGDEIESFFWLLVRLCGLAFGYLLVAGGAIFVLAFVFERLRTGAIALNGSEYRDGMSQLWLIAVPLLIGVGGVLLVRISRRANKKID